MATRFIVRPSGITLTPNALKTALAAQEVITATKPGIEYDPDQDFFFAYPDSSRLKRGAYQGQLASYHQLTSFFCSSKLAQRRKMHEAGISVPRTLGIHFTELCSDKSYVWRPSSHRAGEGFTIVSTDTSCPAGGYLSELFQRTHEYRVIYVLGKRLCTLMKTIPATLTQEQPWTFEAGCTFQDIGDTWTTHRLHSRGCYTALDAFYVAQLAHICAFDVMVNATSYAVSECNFAPSLKLPGRIQKVVNRIREVRP